MMKQNLYRQSIGKREDKKAAPCEKKRFSLSVVAHKSTNLYSKGSIKTENASERQRGASVKRTARCLSGRAYFTCVNININSVWKKENRARK